MSDTFYSFHTRQVNRDYVRILIWGAIDNKLYVSLSVLFSEPSSSEGVNASSKYVLE